jgi:hypothetical protein
MCANEPSILKLKRRIGHVKTSAVSTACHLLVGLTPGHMAAVAGLVREDLCYGLHRIDCKKIAGREESL